MAGNDNRMILAKLPYKFPNLDDLLWIKTYGRLVENDDRRISEYCLRNADSLLIDRKSVV